MHPPIGLYSTIPSAHVLIDSNKFFLKLLWLQDSTRAFTKASNTKGLWSFLFPPQNPHGFNFHTVPPLIPSWGHTIDKYLARFEAKSSNLFLLMLRVASSFFVLNKYLNIATFSKLGAIPWMYKITTNFLICPVFFYSCLMFFFSTF